MPKVTVFSQPNCVPCRKVKTWLDSKGVEYEERDITTDEEAYRHVRELGHMGVPVIETKEKNWSGIDLEKMKELVNA